MSDREAFVAAIAASPADDLPRLVFADWLDENGEPERAEFIRTQIRWHHTTDAEEKQHLNRRAADLYRLHWRQWLRPFLLALDPQSAEVGRYRVDDVGHTGLLATVRRFSEASEGASPVTHVYVSRGFVSLFGLQLSAWDERQQLAAAFAHEPPHTLQVELSPTYRYWTRFSEPALRRIERLTLTETVLGAGRLISAPPAFDDPHLAGVRHLTLAAMHGEERNAIPLHALTVADFAISPLAYRLQGLELPCVDYSGLLPLCRSNRLQLERLSVGGSLSERGVQLLEEGGFPQTVRQLELNEARLGDASVAALARGGWRKLTQLVLSDNGLSSAVLPALASAAFTPQLTDLDLSDNRLFFDQPTDLNGLRVLADVLDPERLVHLNLTNTGLAAVPDFLAERFGDRVSV